MSDPTPAPTPKKRRPAPRKRKPAADKPAAEQVDNGSPASEPAQAAPPAAQPQPQPLIRVPLMVRWRDLDAFNHVNNSKYLSYLEEARLRWMITMPGMGLEDHIAPVVAASNLNYRRPIGWPGDVVVELFVERLGNTSITLAHRIVDAGDNGVLYCDGNVVMVWIDRENGRAAPLPDFVRAACSTAE